MAEIAYPHKQKVNVREVERLKTGLTEATTPAERLRAYRRFCKNENTLNRFQHRRGASGLEIATRRADMVDFVIRNIYQDYLDAIPEAERASLKKNREFPVTIVALGGYGRRTLNPGSDVDILFLCPGSTTALPKPAVDLISKIQLMLFDIGFKLGHASRSIPEAIRHANGDNPTKTSFLDSRFIIGDEALHTEFAARFRKECIQRKERDYLNVRRRDFLSRHEKYDKTVYLQEPNIKEGCGGLRDYQNILWLVDVKHGAKDLNYLLEQKMLSRTAYRAMTKGYDFLMRVRNEMHWSEKPYSDILTLRLQGVVATKLGYPQETILRRIEAFMRDYYRHTRAIYMHSTSVMQAFRLLQEEAETGVIPFLAKRSQKVEHFDGFYSKDGLIYPETKEIFQEDPHRLMRLFLHTQQRFLRLTPQMRKLVKRNYGLVDPAFRYSKANRETFEAIASNRGSVGRTFRQMHRVGFLGKYVPEFGELDCLVQHEFFHRYTADEHTLKCLDVLDSLSDSKETKTAFFQKLFHDLEDPFILYLALLMHDTGRAEDQRYHTDGSVVLTDRVCRRLQIRGERRKLLVFLVDNHLVFWRTATTKNIEDPAVIRQFANVMQNRTYMETLLLMTFADSSATNPDAWTGWKESLLLQLYRSTCNFFEDEKSFGEEARKSRKGELLETVAANLDDTYGLEIEALFAKMPERYFNFRTEENIVRHLKTFRRFLEINQAKEGLESLHPVLNWLPFKDAGYTQLELVCWDRTRLLAKVAGVLAAHEINILSADIFTREDDLVLDVFRVCTTNFEPVTNLAVQKGVESMLKDVLDRGPSQEELERAIPLTKHKAGSFLVEGFPTRVYVNNEVNPNYTVLEIQALDRLGLLYDIFSAIGKLNIEVVNSRINTEKGAAIDSFYLTDHRGRKLREKKMLRELQRALEAAIAH